MHISNYKVNSYPLPLRAAQLTSPRKPGNNIVTLPRRRPGTQVRLGGRELGCVSPCWALKKLPGPQAPHKVLPWRYFYAVGERSGFILKAHDH